MSAQHFRSIFNILDYIEFPAGYIYIYIYIYITSKFVSIILQLLSITVKLCRECFYGFGKKMSWFIWFDWKWFISEKCEKEKLATRAEKFEEFSIRFLYFDMCPFYVWWRFKIWKAVKALTWLVVLGHYKIYSSHRIEIWYLISRTLTWLNGTI